MTQRTPAPDPFKMADDLVRAADMQAAECEATKMLRPNHGKQIRELRRINADLLDALRAILDVPMDASKERYNAELAARAAIAKAEGN